MPTYKITLNTSFTHNSRTYSKGLSVQVSNYINPFNGNDIDLVNDAFIRIHGLDLRKTGYLNLGYLDVKEE